MDNKGHADTQYSMKDIFQLDLVTLSALLDPRPSFLFGFLFRLSSVLGSLAVPRLVSCSTFPAAWSQIGQRVYVSVCL